MTTKLLPFLVLGLLSGAGEAPTAAQKELEKLQGSWTTVSLSFDGKDLSDMLKLRFTFKKNQAVVEGNDNIKKAYATLTFKLDPSTKPPLMDISVADGTQKDTVFEGIYERKETELKLCVRVGGNERPGEFTAEAGSNRALLVLKREP